MSDDSHAGGQDARRRFFRDRGWIAAIILVVIGVILLLQNLGLAVPHNWWALFLLIPAGVALMSGMRAYNRDGGLTAASIGPFVGALVLVALTAVFLLDLEIWKWVGPIALILIGLGILARYVRR